jgi:hypothetical protein
MMNTLGNRRAALRPKRQNSEDQRISSGPCGRSEDDPTPRRPELCGTGCSSSRINGGAVPPSVRAPSCLMDAGNDSETNGRQSGSNRGVHFLEDDHLPPCFSLAHVRGGRSAKSTPNRPHFLERDFWPGTVSERAATQAEAAIAIATHSIGKH